MKIRGSIVTCRNRDYAKVTAKVDRVVKSLYFNFNPNNRQVNSNWNNLDNSNDNDGLRPSGSGVAKPYSLI